MNEQKRNTCENCGVLIAPGKVLCKACEIRTGVGAHDMAASLERMEGAASAHMAEMETRQAEFSERLDSSLSEKLSAERSSATRTHDAGGINVQNLGMFARLEQLCSEIRHSIVEACFYNLKLQAQLLPQKTGSAEFMKEFRRNLGQLPVVAKKIHDFFDEQVDSKLKISSLFGDEYSRVMKGLQQLRETAPQDDEPPEQSAGKAGRLSDAIDAVISGLQAIDDRLRTSKMDVKEILADVAAASRERCDEAGVKLIVQLPEEPLPKIYTTGSVLADAVTELIRNSLKHSFPLAAAPDKTIEIAAHTGEEPHRPVVIQVKDNGCGLPMGILERARNEGVPSGENGFGLPRVIHNIEKVHRGKVSCESVPGEGTNFILSIPPSIRQGDNRNND